MADTLVHNRVTRVVCDKCGAEHYIAVSKFTGLAGPPPTEDQWDTLLVQELHRLGWQAGIEPTHSHRRAVPDVCSACRGRHE